MDHQIASRPMLLSSLQSLFQKQRVGLCRKIDLFPLEAAKQESSLDYISYQRPTSNFPFPFIGYRRFLWAGWRMGGCALLNLVMSIPIRWRPVRGVLLALGNAAAIWPINVGALIDRGTWMLGQVIGGPW